MFEANCFENVLKSLRVRRGKMWTQAKLAESLGVSLRTYRAWEIGESLPTRQDLHHLVSLLALTETEIETLFRAANQVAPVIQNLPFAHNPFFTGRESELSHLQRLFVHNERIAIIQPVSVSGLGGIGKTQLALEYAHRSCPHPYRSVLWVNAENRATLEASYLSLADLLQLRQREEANVERIMQAVKRWLEEYSHWLLILDNADDLQLVHCYLPTKPRGHILLTTRSQIVGGLATQLYVDALTEQEGVLFLLRRSGILKAGEAETSIGADVRQQATTLVQLLGSHPLALDQAGAYLEETGASLSRYLQLYEQKHHRLLQRRGRYGVEHPEAVTTTLFISINKASLLHPACTEVLAFCALLEPDAIAEELLQQEAVWHLDLLSFDEVIAALHSYSLTKRNSEYKTLSLHRLVQAVIRQSMDEQNLRQWTERVVQAVNAAFPEDTPFAQWSQCERLLPHALLCLTWIEGQAIVTPQAASLLYKAGTYLRERGQYTQALPLYLRALAICEQHLGAEHPDTAASLNNLAILYKKQGKYEQAERFYLRALTIREQHLGAEHPDTAASLNNLANLYQNQGKYEQAEPFYLRALAICEQHLETEYPAIARSLNNLANLYRDQGKYEQAEPFYLRALAIREQHLGAEHPDTAASLNDLAILYWQQGKYEQAEPFYLRALAIREQHLGAEHPDTAASLNDLAILYWQQGKYEQAEPFYLRALTIREQHLGAKHPDTAASLNNLAILYKDQGKYEQAEPLYLRALSIYEQYLGAEHPLTATGLNNLAELYWHQENYEQAELFYLRALAIGEQHLGTEHPLTTHPLYGLAQLRQHQGKHEQAETLYQRALHIREQCLGPDHPDTQALRKAYAAFLHAKAGSS